MKIKRCTRTEATIIQEPSMSKIFCYGGNRLRCFYDLFLMLYLTFNFIQSKRQPALFVQLMKTQSCFRNKLQLGSLFADGLVWIGESLVLQTNSKKIQQFC